MGLLKVILTRRI